MMKILVEYEVFREQTSDNFYFEVTFQVLK